MAKTIDDLIVEISGLINVLNQKNGNTSVNGGTPVANTTDEVFSALGNALVDYKERIESLNKTHKNYEETLNTGELKNKIDEFINEINAINSELPKGVTKLKHSNSFIEGYIKEKDKQNNIIADINSKNFKLSLLEVKLHNDKLNIDAAELKERAKNEKELKKFSEITSKASIAFAETAEQIKVFQSEIEAIKAQVKAERKDDIKETEEIKKNNTRKQEQINITHENAMAHKEKKRLEGYNDKGQKKSNAELKELRGDWKKYLKTTDKGRIVADGAKIAAQGAAKGVAGMASGAMNIGSMASGLSSGLSKLGPWGMVAAAIVKVLKESFDMFSKVDKAASNYARSVGGGHYAQVKMRESAAALTKDMSKWG